MKKIVDYKFTEIILQKFCLSQKLFKIYAKLIREIVILLLDTVSFGMFLFIAVQFKFCPHGTLCSLDFDILAHFRNRFSDISLCLVFCFSQFRCPSASHSGCDRSSPRIPIHAHLLQEAAGSQSTETSILVFQQCIPVFPSQPQP